MVYDVASVIISWTFQAALPRMSFVDPVRLCNECLSKTKKEKDFFETHLKILLTGIALFCINVIT